MRRPPKIPRPGPVPRVRSALVDALTPADVPAFWAATAALPVVEPTGVPDEVVVTFCWRDPEAGAAPAEQVLLFANRLTDETSLDDTLLERLAGSDLWHASFRMGSAWRASYSFLVQRRGQPAPWMTDGHVALRSALDHGVPDPGNRETCRNRAGVVQSVVSLPDAPPQPWLLARLGTPRGAVSEEHGPGGRTVWLYDPPGAPVDEPLPLVVALDGDVWTGPQSLPTTLDNLIADGELPPVRAVLPSSADRDARWADLGADGGGVELVVDQLVPFTHSRRGVLPGRVVVAGQSLGGLTALRCGLLRPDVVAGVVSHSASLWQDDLLDLAAAATGSAVRVHLAHGAQEWVLTGPHELLAARLRDSALALDVAVHDGGHDYAWWRGGIADGLRWVLGPAPSRGSVE